MLIQGRAGGRAASPDCELSGGKGGGSGRGVGRGVGDAAG